MIHRRNSVVLTLLLVAVATLSIVGRASANRFSTNETAFVMMWQELVFTSTGAPESPVTCSMTLEGSLHARTFAKVASSLVGYINRAAIQGCTGGTATVLTATLPWHVTYEGYSGTLPNITDVRLRTIGASLRVQPTGFEACLHRTTSTTPLRTAVANEAGFVPSVTVEASGIPGTEGFFCGFTTGSVSGNGTVTTRGGGEFFLALLEAVPGVLRIDRTPTTIERNRTEESIRFSNSAVAGASNIRIPSALFLRVVPNEFFSETIDGCSRNTLVPPEATICVSTVRFNGRAEDREKTGRYTVNYYNGTTRKQTATVDVVAAR